MAGWNQNPIVYPPDEGVVMVQCLNRLGACFAVGATLAGCGGGSDDAPPPGTAARLSIVSGNGQTAEQHLRLPQDLVVSVTDGNGQPVDGVAVEFTPAPGSPSFRTDWPLIKTPNPGAKADGIHWFAFFHTTGPHRILATAAGLPSVTFDVDVVPSTHQYDGFYMCGFGGSETNVMTIIHGAQPYIYGQLEEAQDVSHFLYDSVIDATGAMTAGFRLNLDERLRLGGQMVLDASGQSKGSGTWDRYYHDQPPSLETGVWTCSRF